VWREYAVAVTMLTRAEIRRLATQLDQAGVVLNDADRAALRAVFELAATALAEKRPAARSDIPLDSILTSPPVSRPEPNGGSVAPSPGARELPPLLDGFEGAFQPGGAARFVIEQKPLAEEAVKRPVITARLI
jgi:hypothetical protein